MPSVQTAHPPSRRALLHQGRPLVVLGTSGHAREIAWIAEQADQPVLGCVGPYRAAEHDRLSVPWLGDDDWLDTADPTVRYVVGVGDGALRARIDQAAGRNGRRCGSLVSPTAVIGARCTVGEGSVFWPGAVLTTDVRLGRHVHIGTRATVGHDTVIGDYATLLPGCTVAGSSRIGDGTTVAAGATVVDNISIGRDAVVGAGAVVVRDVPDNVVVVGVPARILRPTRPSAH
ncbi:NeuD/PglB/VioB family sugar acetyltransferase [Micromonospora sp. LOL_025]|uniref:NeuD/PglB/VioB family sugar acetyltransferase n=1 Tax=Micromonospora sp. LOL_025 TaxID=3345413 RepID=UPI003A8A0108